MPITIDGSLNDWTQADRLERPLAAGGDTGLSGYEVYGRFENGNFYIAIHSAEAIGTNTTLWLNTDDNVLTGTQAFAGINNVGAEFNVNFQTPGFASLFTGNAGQTQVANTTGFAWALSADKLTLEVAIPEALLGGNVDTLSFLADINNDQNAFLPGNYDNGGYRINDPAAQQFDGLLNDWTASQRLDNAQTAVAGYEIYGKYDSGDFDFALKSPNLIIGQNTTFWLDTDRNANTGFQAFGNLGDTGAEFNVNIGQDGVARLYTGAAGQTFVGNIQYHIGPDGKTIEFAVPKTLVGDSVTSISMKADVDNTDFLPGSYVSGKYTVTDTTNVTGVTPSDGYRIAIVYSETSANNYFSKMAYSQLFMTAQSQAQAAGIPFDIISDTDLTTANLSNLAHYDAIVFPSFRNVDSAHYQEIQSVLEDLVFNHDIPLIAAGDFMTNDQTGAALSANPYERMTELLGVNRTGGDSNVTVDVVAGNSEITSGYGTGNTIHTYTGATTSYFDPTNPATSTVVATQVVNGVTHDGVVSTVTGGHNVHFATEALLADSNLLGKALDYATAPDTGVQVSLHMSRDESMTASRTDMDQAKEQSDVTGGIYSAMQPMLETLKAQYDFVGSYYFDIGLGSLYEDTGGTQAAILDFEKALLAMGNEVGSHSVTHPENTNLLLTNQLTQAQLDAIRAQYVTLYGSAGAVSGDFTPFALDVDSDPTAEPADVALVQQLRTMTLDQINTALTQALAAMNNPGSLDKLHQAILDATFQYQFQQSKTLIEQALGVTLDGVAIPGMPDSIDTAREIMQYYGYTSGGGSLVGAGYPGAFGYLTPNASDGKVYIAPNVPFDFTLVDFQGHTAAEAEAIWLQYFQDLTKNNDQAIVVWPWHDYAFTQFGVDGAHYNSEMFTAFIAAAHDAGTEFVTLDDLAQRIAAFDKSSLSYTVNGDTISVVAGTTAGNLGTFALDFDSMGAKHIQNVTGWYAYDNDSVFLDADGGNFAVHLGTTSDDVTHITDIASRAKLMTLTGDGVNLTFTIIGEGKIVVDLKAVPGGIYDVTGATVFSQNGDIMTLDLGAIASHNVSISLRANHAPVGADGVVGLLEDGSHAFAAADFGFTDQDGNLLSGVKITTLPSIGTLTLGGVAIAANQVVAAADLGTLVWTPPANFNGNSASFTFQVIDNGGTFNGGQDTDQTPNTITFNVTPVNDAPDGADKTITILEDSPRSFSTADFGFTDVLDGNSLSAVKITTLPTGGALTLNGNPVAAGALVLVADLPHLTWTPPLNANGAGIASFTFQVVDNGGTANSGVDTDPTPNTITFNVTPVNDAPSGLDKAVTILEDSAYTFAATDFGFSDVDNNGFLGVKITTVPAAGTLTLGGVAVGAGAFVAAALIPTLVWTAPANANGTPVGSFTFQVVDDGGTANTGVDTDTSPKTFTINVTPVNDAPSGIDKTITVQEDTAKTFAASDFAFTDIDGNTLQSVKIVALPTVGTLMLDNVAVIAGQVIAATDIGHLVWTPPANQNGLALATFTFQVQDNGGTANGGVDLDPTAHTITLNVTPVNDAPSGTDKTLVLIENTSHSFVAADFGFTDADNNGLKEVIISSLPPVAGSLTFNGVAVTVGQHIAAANLGQLVWTAPVNSIGAGLGTFTFQVVDNGPSVPPSVNTDPTPNTLTINVIDLNHAPSGADKTVIGDEDTAHTFAASDFGFTDPDGHSLLSIVIASLPSVGLLTLNGTAVTAGQTILAADVGQLVWTPPANVNGSPVASFTFKVIDDGGTVNGGHDTDDTPNTITFNLTPVADAPVITSNGGGDNAAVNVAENNTAVTTVTATDADAGDTRTYSIAGGADAAKFSIDASTGALSFKAAPNFEFKADAGGDGVYDVVVKVTDGQNLFDTQAIAVTVTGVNEAPFLSGVQVPTVSMEAGSTKKVLGLSPLIDPEGDALTYKLKALPGGSLFLASGTAVVVNQVLTQAQFLSLAYSSPQSAGHRFAQFDVSDGTNHTALTVDLNVTPGVSKTYTGTSGVNRLDGAAGNDTINGLGGADTMIGGTGKDKYIVDNAGDRVDERGGNGIDTVQSSVTYSLANTARVFGAVENLTLSGAKAINGIGNALANTITGNAAANVLSGGLGSDKLNGMLGKDTLVGGKGNDFFVFTTKPSSANIDKITDFHNVKGDNDTFQLDNAVFTKLGAVGHLKSGFFFNGTSAHDGDDHIIYNKASGALFYDSDGIGGHAQVQFATLTNHVTLTASDFNVI